jgi:hypothetical protein
MRRLDPKGACARASQLQPHAGGDADAVIVATEQRTGASALLRTRDRADQRQVAVRQIADAERALEAAITPVKTTIIGDCIGDTAVEQQVAEQFIISADRGAIEPDAGCTDQGAALERSADIEMNVG